MPVDPSDYLTEPPADDEAILRDFTLPGVFAAAAERAPDAVAITDRTRSMTWREWRAEVDGLARGLQESGVGPGDVVAVQLGNCADFETVHLAVAAAGAVMMPVHLGNGDADVRALLDRAEPAAVVLPARVQDGDGPLRGDALREAVPSLRTVLVAGEAAAERGEMPLNRLRADWHGHAPHPVDVRPGMPFVLLPSSGTTSSRPKICLHSHQGLLSNTYTVVEEGADAFTGGVLVACTLTHLFGLQSMYSALFTGCAQALLGAWDPDRFFEVAAQADPGIVFAVPTQLHDIVAGARAPGVPAGVRPRQVRTAGAALPAALVTELRDALGAEVIVVWGMSEIGYGTRTRAEDPPDVATRTVGRPAPGSAVRVVDDAGEPCAAGVPGDLQYRGTGMFRGYFGDPELTRASLTPDGWLRTGDRAALTGDGLVVFHGRAAELINVGGAKFNATEIQGLLAELPGLGPAAVVGKPDPRLGEYPCLIVTGQAARGIGLPEVTRFLSERGVADYKIPLELVAVPELPRTAVGKINRLALEELVAADAPAASPDGAAGPAPSFGGALRLVRDCAADVLGLDSGDDVDTEESFHSQGMDSVQAVRLRNLIADAIGRPLPASLAFDHPSAAAVARHLSGPPGSTTAAPPAAAPRPAVAPRPAADEPVAVIGMACRYPGGADTPERLWKLLTEEAEAISGFPVDRGWDLENLFDPDPDRPGTSYADSGGFLHDAGRFDAGFFGFSDREALATDPQQRLLLEVAWEAIERARIDPAALRGGRTGVFAGTMHHGYGAGRPPGSAELEGLLEIGSAAGAVSGRISHLFGFEGPALTVDTACSSSLVALHLACRSLNAGESTLALAGGVTVMPAPTPFMEFSRLRGLAPDGRCKPYAAAADGTAFGEGAGILLLERLSDARRNGRRILGVIRGSAVNQDGASNGLTAPNGPAQERVIRDALAAAGVPAAEVDAVEGHGTGTSLGDPIEAQALIAAYGRDRPAGRPLWLGSLKSNIGHTQAAAGVAGVIKMVLAMRHGTLPRTLHLDEPSPHVDWSAGTVVPLARTRPWPRPDRPRRAGVSSFGISGTNAHVIVEEAPAEDITADTATREDTDDRPAPWVLSARSEPALRAQARRLAEHLAAGAAPARQDVAYSLATTRALHDHRAVLTGADRTELLSVLAALGDAESAHPIIRARRGPGGLAFAFTGQGSQRLGMGRGLAAAFPVFAAALDRVGQALDPLLDRPLTSVMWAEPGTPEARSLDTTGYAQPALFAFEVALYRLLESWGVRPGHLVGHSVGEIAAAHAAGVLGLADACALVAARGRLMQALPPGGAMLAARLPEDEVAPWLAGHEDSIAIAAVNGPHSVVLSGAAAPLAELATRLDDAGFKTRRLRVSHAFHSPLMEPMLADFRAVVGSLSFAAPAVPLISDLDGRPLTEREARDPGHWVRHVREPVRFRDAIDHLRRERVGTFLEIGPAAALTPMIHECLEASAPNSGGGSGGDSGWAAVPACDGGPGEEHDVLAAAGRLHASGVPVDWAEVLPTAETVPLPTYAFQHRSYWLAASPGGPGESGSPAGTYAGPHTGPESGRTALAARLSGLDDRERDELLLSTVLEQVTAVLGGDLDGADGARTFVELGVKSVNAVELCNRLTTVSGVWLPSTVVFDHPTPAAVARLIRDGLGGGPAPAAAGDLLDALERALAEGAELDGAAAERLRTIAARHASPAGRPGGGLALDTDLDTATDEELFRLMDGDAARS
ncbi:beta-ketoacyl synthase N-terminal-like domain-containing protein [Actinomadura welshii]